MSGTSIIAKFPMSLNGISIALCINLSQFKLQITTKSSLLNVISCSSKLSRVQQISAY